MFTLNNLTAQRFRMEFIFNNYALTLLFLGGIELVLSFYILLNEKSVVRWVGFMMLANSIWSMAYGAELASINLMQMKICVDIEYIGITWLPVAWFIFCLELAEKEKWYQKLSNKLLITVIPVLTLLLAWTNDFHHLHYKELSVDYTGDFPMLSIVPAIGFKIFTVFFYLLFVIGSYLLIVKYKNSDSTYRKQNYLIIIAAFIPFLANFCYMIGLRPLIHLDPTPFAFLLTTILVFIGIYRFKLFDILPVARKKILELMEDGFIVMDNHKRIIDYNPAFKKYNGNVSSNKITGKRIDEIFPDQAILIELINQGYTGKHLLFINTRTGLCEIEADIRIIHANPSEQIATIIKLQDVTEIRKEALKSKQQTEELKTLNALKDRIFSIMAHDLRGPLLNISEVLKMIANNTIDLNEFKMLSPTLTKDIAYTTDLLENILHWSRSQLNGYGINRELLDLKQLITSEVNYHLPAATLKKINVFQAIPDNTMIYADVLMMQIVIRNLITNAIKFCKEGCWINIYWLEKTKDYVDICIEDNGVGISEEVIKRLFSGENISSRGTQNEKGTGLGLMVCRDFMERNEGSITIKSVLNQGTQFYLSIPSSKK